MTREEIKTKILKTNCFIDNEYLDKYVDLIINNLDKQFVKFECDRHHIIPKNYYRKFKLRIDNSKDNIVVLTHKDHLLAHYYLYNCSLDEDIKVANGIPLWLIDKRGLEPDECQKIVEESRRYYSSLKIGVPLSKETKEKLSKALKGHYVSEEHKQYLRSVNKGKHLSQETRNKLSAKRKGKRNSPRTEFKKGHPSQNKGKKGIHLSPRTEFTRERTLGANNPRAYKVYQYTLDGTLIAEYETATKASEVTGVHRGSICLCRCGRIKTAGGFIWKSKDYKLQKKGVL